MPEPHAVGAPVPRVDGVDKVTGRARYAVDRTLPGMLHGDLLHSTRPHARIVRIDTSEAAALPGVHAVLTGADVRGHLYGRRIKDMPVLADGVVRYAGERVAAVAADDPATARRAVDLIRVEYEDLPAVFDVREAAAPGAPLLHPAFGTYPGTRPLETPSNVYHHAVTDRGDDLEAAFARADYVIEHTFETQRVHQVYLEPHASLVSIEDGRIHVWTNTKAPYAIREALAITIGVEPGEILMHHSHIGGDFGGKGTPLDLPVCYYLARAAGRPVRIVADYAEEFLAGNPRHSSVTTLRTGVMRDGTLVAHHARFTINAGAYAAYKPGGRIGGAPRTAGPYRIPHTRVESLHVYTNTVPGGHMRSPGSPQAIFALESHLDAIAREIGVDPLDFRLRNLIAEGDEPASGEHLEHVRVRETLEAAVAAAGYRAPRPPHVGRGIAIGDHGAGGGEGNTAVTLHPDGSIVLGTPIFDQGSGTYTTLEQVVAEELAVPVERIALEIWDTDGAENDAGIGGSRASRVNTAAAYAAAQDAKRALAECLARHLGVAAEEVTIEGDQALVRGGAPRPWGEVLAGAGETVTGRSHVTEAGAPSITSFAAQVAEVRVDPETGEIRVLGITTAHDVGRVLNPIGHQGQINGGVAQGLGYALMEELPLEEGRVTTLSFGDYKIPSIADVPPLRTVVLESPYGTGPYQVKGIGETPNIPVAAAIANAIADATGGVRVTSLPITAEKLYRALREREGTS